MTNSQPYKLNEPKVTGERLDGEFILLHFETGCYFSVVSTSADVCQLLFDGHPPSAITEALASHYGLDNDAMRKSVDGFVTQLVDEGLIVAVDKTDASMPKAPSFSSEFTELGFEKFDDMSEQLLLDPIHEIGDDGWPQVKQA